MNSPELARLQLEASRAQEHAKLAAARAAIAEIDQQRRALDAQNTVRSTVSGITYVVAAVFVAFVAWAYVTEPDPSSTPPRLGASATAAQR